MAKELMTMAAYARLRQLNRSTISYHVKTGLIPTHGPRRLIDPREADRHLRKHLDPARRNGKGTSADAGLNTARAGHAYWKARLARLELEEMRRRVGKTAEYREGWAHIFAVCRKAHAPQDVLSGLAAETEMHMAISLLDSSVRGVLVELHGKAKRRVKRLARNLEPQEPERAPDPSNYRQCLERREKYMSEIKKLQVGLKRGQYVYEHEVNKAITDALSSFKDRSLAIPHRVAAQVSATEDPAEIDKILADAFKEAVDGLPEDITEGLTVVEIEEDGTDED